MGQDGQDAGKPRVWSTPEVWVPIVQELRNMAPPGTVSTCLAGTVGWRGWNGSAPIDFDATGHGTKRREPWSTDALDGVCAAAGQERLAFDIEARPDGGTAHVMLSDDAARVGVSRGVRELVLIPGSMPAPFTQRPVTYPVTTAAKANPGQVVDTVKRLQRRSTGASEASISRAEKRWGVRFPAELRALYSTASSGELIDKQAGDEGAIMRITPLAGEFRDWPAQTIAPEWSTSADRVFHDPSGKVQDLPVSSGWIQIGDDWGGSYWVMDLTPGPNGHVGQVLFIDRDDQYGACWVADSLAEFLLLSNRYPVDQPSHDWQGMGPYRDYLLRVGDGSGRSIAEVAPTTQVVELFGDQSIDMAVLAGHPSIRSVTVNGSVTSWETLATLPALEWLNMGMSDWIRLLDAGQVPATLKAAGFIDQADLIPTTMVFNRLLSLWGRDTVLITAIQIEL